VWRAFGRFRTQEKRGISTKVPGSTRRAVSLVIYLAGTVRDWLLISVAVSPVYV
jgi:hypothetical protein